MTDLLRSAKIRPHHLRRLAVVYVRQSTVQQVAEHQESTARQYALADRAVAMGWPADAVLVIDDDLGKSAASAAARAGFQRLLAEVALDHVGLVLGLEMSRLARSCSDWHQLLEVCARFGVLLGDSDGVYDPTDYNDRLLLGLKGTMSEAELHILKGRLYQGKLNKARRGELFNTPPIGYVKRADGSFDIDPDEQVQAVVRLIFDQFERQGTVHGLLRYLVHHQVQIPVRPHHGEQRGQLQWRRPNRATLLNLLHHPIYAGVYRYGHRQIDPRRQQPDRPGTGRTKHPAGAEVLLPDRLPAYISRERFEANQERLAANRTHPESLGATRQGAALLSGLLRCGYCQRRMSVRYSGHAHRQHYICGRATADYGAPLCQSLSGVNLDRLVTEQILQAVQPAALQASLAAVEEVERERLQLTQQWQLRLERAAHEAERAARQYQLCEPENRLVARELERRWERALAQQQQLQQEFARWQQTAPARLSAADVEAIGRLASDLPAVWQAATTTPADRQRIARLLLERIVVRVDKASEQVEVQLHWAGGQQSQHRLRRPVRCYAQQAEYGQLVSRLEELCAAKESSERIATLLNEEGYRPPKRTARFTAGMVQRLVSSLGLTRRERAGSAAGLEANEYRPSGLARRLGIKRDRVRRWLKAGWLRVRRDEQGDRIIWADEEELERLRELVQLPRTWANRQRLKELQKPKERPVE
jgi:DNA invertase Pin-like site-specific DNA recombinase